MKPQDAIERLTAGNARFVAGMLDGSRDVPARRAAVSDVQHPFAMVLCCADSRVVPELIFDQRLGDLFVCRVGGNILDPAVLGTFEFGITAVESLAVLVVLGHERCSALTESVACIREGRRPEGPFQTIVDAIAPAVAPGAEIDAIVRANAQHVAREAVRRSAPLRDAVAQGRLAVVAAHYAMGTGVVTVL
jgi:carbonic anhydrase